MSKEIEKKIEALREKIRKYSDSYHQQAKSIISDPEFDKLLQELEKLEQENPHLITPDSPTQVVGSDLTEESKRIKHKKPMLSIKNEKDLFKFDKGIKKRLAKNEIVEYVVEPKIDGASVSLEYENGTLRIAATRGDGEEGEDITENIKTIKNIPSRLKRDISIPYNLDSIIVRGEIFIYIEDFEKIKKEQKEREEKVFENPRNTAAGILKTEDSKIVAKIPLNNFAYTLLSMTEEFDSQDENLEILRKLGFIVNNLSIKCNSIEEVVEACENLERVREELPYEIDGAVIKVNSIEQQKKLPERPKYPRWAAAFKFNPKQAPSTIKNITWQVGRTGTVTPVAELEPVRLAGSTIRRATLHNYDEIKRKDIRVKDEVIIEKGGDVIPKVVEVVKTRGKKRSGITKPPKKCPECGTELSKSKGEVAYYCKNPECPAQLINKVQHFVARGSLDIEGIGGIVSERLIDANLIDSPFDIFKIDKDKLASLNLGTKEEPRIFGEKNATKVMRAIERAKTKPFNKWLFAIGIPKLGELGTRALAEKHHSIQEIRSSSILKNIVLLKELTDKAMDTNPRAKKNKNKSKSEKERLELQHSKLCDEIVKIGDSLVEAGWYKRKIEESRKTEVRLTPIYVLDDNKGIGAETAKSVLDFLSSNRGKELINNMRNLGVHKSEIEEKGNLLDGKVFVLTGTLPNMKRPQATELIIKNGGKVTGKVSKNTDFLLAGAEPGSKYEEAQKLSVEIISEEQLLKMIT